MKGRTSFWLLSFCLLSVPSVMRAQGQAVKTLSLEEALRLALPASESVARARVAVERARGDELRAKSGLLPQISGSVAYARQLKSQFTSLFATEDTTTGPPAPTSCDAFSANPVLPISERIAALERAVECATTVNPFAGLGNLPFGRRNTYTLGLSGSQLLFDGGRVFGQVRSARANRDAARIEQATVEAQLVLEVVEAYADAFLGDQLVVISEATLAQADTTLRHTELRFQVGSAPEFDVLRARVARDNQRPLVIQARTGRALAHIRLKQLLNLPAADSVALTTELSDTAFAAVPTLARLASATPDTAAAHRAVVRQADEAIRAQEGLAAASRAQRLPAVALSSQFSRIAYPSRGLPGFDEFVTDWQVSLGVQVPIFTGGRLRGDRIASRALLDDVRLRRQQALEGAELDARTAIADLEAAVATWSASEGTAAQAVRAYEIADLRFREGVSTQTELLDARIALQQAQVNRAQAARNLQIARVRLALIADLPLGLAVGRVVPTSLTPPSNGTSQRPSSQ